MCGLSFERPLSTTNKMADQRNILVGSNFFIAHSDSGLFPVYGTVVLHSTDSVLKNSSHATMFSWFISPSFSSSTRYNKGWFVFIKENKNVQAIKVK